MKSLDGFNNCTRKFYIVAITVQEKLRWLINVQSLDDWKTKRKVKNGCGKCTRKLRWLINVKERPG
jgi:hypothetical protein